MEHKVVDYTKSRKSLDMNYGFYCPFRRYDTNREFRPCLERGCMAFRADDKTFWCAMIEAYGRTPINSKHPIEMLHGID